MPSIPCRETRKLALFGAFGPVPMCPNWLVCSGAVRRYRSMPIPRTRGWALAGTPRTDWLRYRVRPRFSPGNAGIGFVWRDYPAPQGPDWVCFLSLQYARSVAPETGSDEPTTNELGLFGKIDRQAACGSPPPGKRHAGYGTILNPIGHESAAFLNVGQVSRLCLFYTQHTVPAVRVKAESANNLGIRNRLPPASNLSQAWAQRRLSSVIGVLDLRVARITEL